MKRLLSVLLLLCALPLHGWAELPRLGVCAYSGTDTFILSLVAQLSEQAEGKAELSVVYAQADQNIQNGQIQQLMREGVQVLLVNAVDRTSAVYLIELASKQGLPIILFNREPLARDIEGYERAYYVGIDPRQQGALQAQLMMDAFLRDPKLDLNGDGRLQYVLLRGEPGHQDTELRSLALQQALREQAFPAEKLAEETAFWQKSLGQERMAALINSLGRRIECVISNNDDMALGAIEALKAAGYMGLRGGIPVIGVDATQPALEAILQGSLYGTVQNDAKSQAEALMALSLLLARGEKPTADNYPYEMARKLVYLPSRPISREEP